MMVVFPPLENDEYFAAEFDEETLTNQEEQTAQGLQGTQSLPS